MAVRSIEDMERFGAPDLGIWPARVLSVCGTASENVTEHACVIGDGSQALATGTVVIGIRSSATAIGSVALGHFLTANRNGQILIGSARRPPPCRAYFESETNLFMSCVLTVSIAHRMTNLGIEMQVDVHCTCGHHAS